MARLHLRELRNRQLSFFPVLISFLILLLLPPYLPEQHSELFFEVAVNLNLLTCLFLVARTKQQMMTGGIIAAIAIFGGLYSKHPDTEPHIYFTSLLYIAYLMFICAHLLRLLLTNQGSLNLILASICLYLLLGLMWALIYCAVELSVPGSFALGDNPPKSFNELYSILMYYSFVTLSTLGYGDLLPLSSEARGWAISQAIFGQFYFAIVVARLLSQALSEQEHRQQEKHKKERFLAKH